MRRLMHPLTRATYEWAADGIGPVHVVDRDGREGRFDRDGRWVQGPLYTADPELCRWIVSGGPTASGAGGRSRRFESESATDSTTDSLVDTAADAPGDAR